MSKSISKYFIVDRRLSSKDKSTPNRQKFLKRIESQIKDNIPNVLDKESIKDISDGGSVNVVVKGIDEPMFMYDKSVGTNHRIFPGNPGETIISKFDEGEQFEKPKGGKGSGKGKGSNDPTVGEDEFVVSISRDEFLKYFFEDLELPDLIKKTIQSQDEVKLQRHGFRKDGPSSNLDLVRSFKTSLSRRIGMKASLEEKIKKLKEEYELTKGELILIEIQKFEKKLKQIPFLDDSDLIYRRFEFDPQPSVAAVMFCIMDISGSMTQKHKDLSRRYFTLLYLFLTKQYSRVDIVYIQHHTEAKEVTEDEFFNSKENGGTIVLPSLELCSKIIHERYTTDYNIYISTASDGDTWSNDDAIECYKYMKMDLLPIAQYITYSEILTGGTSDLWKQYSKLKKSPNFSMSVIDNKEDVWKVFRKMFVKK